SSIGWSPSVRGRPRRGTFWAGRSALTRCHFSGLSSTSSASHMWATPRGSTKRKSVGNSMLKNMIVLLPIAATGRSWQLPSFTAIWKACGRKSSSKSVCEVNWLDEPRPYVLAVDDREENSDGGDWVDHGGLPCWSRVGEPARFSRPRCAQPLLCLPEGIGRVPVVRPRDPARLS